MDTDPPRPASPFAALVPADVTRPGLHFVMAQPWFAALTPEAQGRVMQGVYTLQGGKGETVLRAGEPVAGWYAVLTGLVKLQSQSSSGRRQAYLGITGGEWFGEGSVMRTEPRRYDVITLRDTELLCLPREVFHELADTSLAFNQYIARHLNMRLGQALAVIEAMRLRSPDQRVAMYLSPLLWHGSRRVSLSQEELGVLAGLSRQTVNAVLNDFERRKLVSLDFGRIEVRDEPGLIAVAWPQAAAPSAAIAKG